MQTQDRYFLTGGQGFIGAWIAKQLLLAGSSCVLFDLKPDDGILAQVFDEDELRQLERVYGDVGDTEVVRKALDASQATNVIHLAGLQIPTCRSQPLLGARVNVIGTLNIFEAVRQSGGRVKNVVYASSAAVAGSSGDYKGPIADDTPHVPRTHYGVFKTANEGSARVYWLDHGIPSVGLRPLAVYGVGREVGVTSGPTKAIKAALLRRPYTIGFSGQTAFNYVEDAARIFIDCSKAAREGAQALNMRGEYLTVEEFAKLVEREVPGSAGLIRVSGGPIPVAYDFVEPGLEKLLGRVPHTPVADGVHRTAQRFRRLLELGKLRDQDLAT